MSNADKKIPFKQWYDEQGFITPAAGSGGPNSEKTADDDFAKWAAEWKKNQTITPPAAPLQPAATPDIGGKLGYASGEIGAPSPAPPKSFGEKAVELALTPLKPWAQAAQGISNWLNPYTPPPPKDPNMVIGNPKNPVVTPPGNVPPDQRAQQAAANDQAVRDSKIVRDVDKKAAGLWPTAYLGKSSMFDEETYSSMLEKMGIKSPFQQEPEDALSTRGLETMWAPGERQALEALKAGNPFKEWSTTRKYTLLGSMVQGIDAEISRLKMNDSKPLRRTALEELSALTKQRLQESGLEKEKDFEGVKSLTDPAYWATAGAKNALGQTILQAPNMATALAATMLTGGMAAPYVASATGVATTGAELAAMGAGTALNPLAVEAARDFASAAVTRPGESTDEAAATFDEVYNAKLAQHVPEAQARREAQAAAQKTYWANMALFPVDMFQAHLGNSALRGLGSTKGAAIVFGAKNPIVRGAIKAAVKMGGIGMSGISESAEEVVQTAIQRWAAGKPIFANAQEYKNAAAGGFLPGALFAAAHAPLDSGATMAHDYVDNVMEHNDLKGKVNMAAFLSVVHDLETGKLDKVNPTAISDELLKRTTLANQAGSQSAVTAPTATTTNPTTTPPQATPSAPAPTVADTVWDKLQQLVSVAAQARAAGSHGAAQPYIAQVMQLRDQINEALQPFGKTLEDDITGAKSVNDIHAILGTQPAPTPAGAAPAPTGAPTAESIWAKMQAIHALNERFNAGVTEAEMGQLVEEAKRLGAELTQDAAQHGKTIADLNSVGSLAQLHQVLGTQPGGQPGATVTEPATTPTAQPTFQPQQRVVHTGTPSSAEAQTTEGPPKPGDVVTWTRKIDGVESRGTVVSVTSDGQIAKVWVAGDVDAGEGTRLVQTKAITVVPEGANLATKPATIGKSGTVLMEAEGEALVSFDDGDRAWIPVAELTAETGSKTTGRRVPAASARAAATNATAEALHTRAEALNMQFEGVYVSSDGNTYHVSIRATEHSPLPELVVRNLNNPAAVTVPVTDDRDVIKELNQWELSLQANTTGATQTGTTTPTQTPTATETPASTTSPHADATKLLELRQQLLDGTLADKAAELAVVDQILAIGEKYGMGWLTNRDVNGAVRGKDAAAVAEMFTGRGKQTAQAPAPEPAQAQAPVQEQTTGSPAQGQALSDAAKILDLRNQLLEGNLSDREAEQAVIDQILAIGEKYGMGWLTNRDVNGAVRGKDAAAVAEMLTARGTPATGNAGEPAQAPAPQPAQAPAPAPAPDELTINVQPDTATRLVDAIRAYMQARKRGSSDPVAARAAMGEMNRIVGDAFPDLVQKVTAFPSLNPPEASESLTPWEALQKLFNDNLSFITTPEDMQDLFSKIQTGFAGALGSAQRVVNEDASKAARAQTLRNSVPEEYRFLLVPTLRLAELWTSYRVARPKLKAAADTLAALNTGVQRFIRRKQIQKAETDLREMRADMERINSSLGDIASLIGYANADELIATLSRERPTTDERFAQMVVKHAQETGFTGNEAAAQEEPAATDEERQAAIPQTYHDSAAIIDRLRDQFNDPSLSEDDVQATESALAGLLWTHGFKSYAQFDQEIGSHAETPLDIAEELYARSDDAPARPKPKPMPVGYGTRAVFTYKDGAGRYQNVRFIDLAPDGQALVETADGRQLTVRMDDLIAKGAQDQDWHYEGEPVTVIGLSPGKQAIIQTAGGQRLVVSPGEITQGPSDTFAAADQSDDTQLAAGVMGQRSLTSEEQADIRSTVQDIIDEDGAVTGLTALTRELALQYGVHPKTIRNAIDDIVPNQGRGARTKITPAVKAYVRERYDAFTKASQKGLTRLAQELRTEFPMDMKTAREAIDQTLTDEEKVQLTAQSGGGRPPVTAHSFSRENIPRLKHLLALRQIPPKVQAIEINNLSEMPMDVIQKLKKRAGDWDGWTELDGDKITLTRPGPEVTPQTGSDDTAATRGSKTAAEHAAYAATGVSSERLQLLVTRLNTLSGGNGPRGLLTTETLLQMKKLLVALNKRDATTIHTAAKSVGLRTNYPYLMDRYPIFEATVNEIMAAKKKNAGGAPDPGGGGGGGEIAFSRMDDEGDPLKPLLRGEMDKAKTQLDDAQASFDAAETALTAVKAQGKFDGSLVNRHREADTQLHRAKRAYADAERSFIESYPEEKSAPTSEPVRWQRAKTGPPLKVGASADLDSTMIAWVRDRLSAGFGKAQLASNFLLRFDRFGKGRTDLQRIIDTELTEDEQRQISRGPGGNPTKVTAPMIDYVHQSLMNGAPVSKAALERDVMLAFDVSRMPARKAIEDVLSDHENLRTKLIPHGNTNSGERARGDQPLNKPNGWRHPPTAEMVVKAERFLGKLEADRKHYIQGAKNIADISRRAGIPYSTIREWRYGVHYLAGPVAGFERRFTALLREEADRVGEPNRFGKLVADADNNLAFSKMDDEGGNDLAAAQPGAGTPALQEEAKKDFASRDGEGEEAAAGSYKPMTVREMRKLLNSWGWMELPAGRRSHVQFTHPEYPGRVGMPNHGEGTTLGPPAVKIIMKQVQANQNAKLAPGDNNLAFSKMDDEGGNDLAAAIDMSPEQKDTLKAQINADEQLDEPLMKTFLTAYIDKGGAAAYKLIGSQTKPKRWAKNPAYAAYFEQVKNPVHRPRQGPERPGTNGLTPRQNHMFAMWDEHPEWTTQQAWAKSGNQRYATLWRSDEQSVFYDEYAKRRKRENRRFHGGWDTVDPTTKLTPRQAVFLQEYIQTGQQRAAQAIAGARARDLPTIGGNNDPENQRVLAAHLKEIVDYSIAWQYRRVTTPYVPSDALADAISRTLSAGDNPADEDLSFSDGGDDNELAAARDMSPEQKDTLKAEISDNPDLTGPQKGFLAIYIDGGAVAARKRTSSKNLTTWLNNSPTLARYYELVRNPEGGVRTLGPEQPGPDGLTPRQRHFLELWRQNRDWNVRMAIQKAGVVKLFTGWLGDESSAFYKEYAPLRHTSPRRFHAGWDTIDPETKLTPRQALFLQTYIDTGNYSIAQGEVGVPAEVPSRNRSQSSLLTVGGNNDPENILTFQEYFNEIRQHNVGKNWRTRTPYVPSEKLSTAINAMIALDEEDMDDGGTAAGRMGDEDHPSNTVSAQVEGQAVANIEQSPAAVIRRSQALSEQILRTGNHPIEGRPITAAERAAEQVRADRLRESLGHMTEPGHKPTLVERDYQVMQQLLHEEQQQLSQGLDADGRPLTPETRRGLEKGLTYRRRLIEEMQNKFAVRLDWDDSRPDLSQEEQNWRQVDRAIRDGGNTIAASRMADEPFPHLTALANKLLSEERKEQRTGPPLETPQVKWLASALIARQDVDRTLALLQTLSYGTSGVAPRVNSIIADQDPAFFDRMKKRMGEWARISIDDVWAEDAAKKTRYSPTSGRLAAVAPKRAPQVSEQFAEELLADASREGNNLAASQMDDELAASSMPPTPPNKTFQFADPVVESRWQAARVPPAQETAWEKLLRWGRDVVNVSTLEYAELPHTADNAPLRNELHKLGKSGIADFKAQNIIREYTQTLVNKPEAFQLAARDMVMSNIHEQIERARALGYDMTYLTEHQLLPFGFKSVSDFYEEYRRLQAHIAAHPDQAGIDKAVVLRMSLRKRLSEAIIDAGKAVGLDLTASFTRDDYYHQMVLKYQDALRHQYGYNAKLSLADVTDASQMKARKVGAMGLDYSTDFLRAEAKVLESMARQLQVLKVLKVAVDKHMSMATELQKQASAMSIGSPDPVDWRTLHPDNWVWWEPEKGPNTFRMFTEPQQYASQIIDDLVNLWGLEKKDFQNLPGGGKELMDYILSLGGDRMRLLLPQEWAKTMNTVGRIPHPDEAWENVSMTLLKAPNRFWKQYTLMGPRRMFGYNVRNEASDIDATISGNLNPKLVTADIPWAFRELMKVLRKEPIDEHSLLFKAMERGLMVDNLQASSEIAKPDDLERFFNVLEQDGVIGTAKRGDILGAGKKLAKLYWGTTRDMTDAREALLRLAQFKNYFDQLIKNEGKPDNYGASIPGEVEAIDNYYDKAYMLQNELMGAYDEAPVLAVKARQWLMPYVTYRFANMRRVYGLMRNAWYSGRMGEALAKKAGGSLATMPVKVARLGWQVAKLSFLWTMAATMINPLTPHDDEEIPDDLKGTPYFIWGRDSAGKLRIFKGFSVLNDALNMGGLDQPTVLAQKLFSGQMTPGEVAKKMGVNAFNDAVGQTGVIVKVPQEAILGVTNYPNATESRYLRDRWEQVWAEFSLRNEYKWLFDKPLSGTGTHNQRYMQSWLGGGTGLYSTVDPREAAYYDVLDYKSQFFKDQGNTGQAYTLSPRSNALYYAKLAVGYGDWESGWKQYTDFIMLTTGVQVDTPEDIRKLSPAQMVAVTDSFQRSLDSLYPLYGMKPEDKMKFLQSLTPEQKRKVQLGMMYWVQRLKPDQKDNIQDPKNLSTQ